MKAPRWDQQRGADSRTDQSRNSDTSKLPRHEKQALTHVTASFLVERINAAHDAAHGAARTAIEKAVECGQLLLEAKASIGHGGWLPWVKANLSFSDRQARKYMRLAQHAEELPNRNCGSDLGINEALAAISSERQAHPAGSGSVEWYTPALYVECARQALGDFDVDPASSKAAQETVRARTYFTKEDDGLAQNWNGRVWCNPPYCDAGKFVDKLIDELDAGRATSAVILVNAYCDTRWFHRAANACAAICFPLGRIYFERPDGEQMSQPAYGSAFIYFGRPDRALQRSLRRAGTDHDPRRRAEGSMSAPCDCFACMTAQARQDRQSEKRGGPFDPARWPGKRFEMAALPVGLLLTREERGWSARQVMPPASGGGS
jgi:phage N-6-adenine-methyltransferase